MASKPAAPKISLAFGSKKGPPPKLKAKPAPSAKRGRATFDDSDHEDDGATETRAITSFAGGQAIDENGPKQPSGLRVIAPPAEVQEGGWLERAMKKRQQGPLPTREQKMDNTSETVNGGDLSYGLTVSAKQDEDDVTMQQAEPVAQSTAQAPPKTDDELALQALIEGKANSNRVIPTVVNEKEAFQQAYQEAPDMATIDEYEATPIEGFGAALLRGMGWKDGQSIGRRRDGVDVKPRVLERRPALLGIGAKPEDATGDELGAWGKGDKKKGRQQQQSYVPVILKNKRTGEEITEEELKKRQEQGKLLENGKDEEKRRSRSPERADEHREERRDGRRTNYSDSRDRRDARDDRDRHRERERDRDRDVDRRRYDGKDRDRDSHRSRHDRSTSSSSKHRKRRRDDSYDRDRSSRKERRRDDDYDSGRDRDRDRNRDRRRRDDDDRYHRDRDSRRDRDRR